jgi:hypothetical protein
MSFTVVLPNNTSWNLSSTVTTPSWSSEDVGQNSYFIESTIGVKDWGYFRRPAESHDWDEQTLLNWEDYA